MAQGGDSGVEQAGRIRGRIESAVAAMHRLTRGRLQLHPYHLFFDTGLLVVAALIVVFWATVQRIDLPMFLLVFVITAVAYEGLYLPAKELLFGIEVRSYLQDLVACIVPVCLGSAWLLGLDMLAALDLLGLQLAALLAVVRVGCFFGGCCYGIPSQYGIRYPSEIFRPHDGLQSFVPDEDPGTRVFPIQLVESAFNGILFVVLYARLLQGGVDGLTLPLYLFAYASYRLASDAFRTVSPRPEYGPLTEAQVVSLGILLVTGPVVLLQL